MTLEELKTRMDNFIGLDSTIEYDNSYEANLVYLGRTALSYLRYKLQLLGMMVGGLRVCPIPYQKLIGKSFAACIGIKL